MLQTVVTLVNLAGRRLGPAGTGEEDLEQAQLAIEAARALLPLCPEEQLGPIKQALSPAADGLRPGDQAAPAERLRHAGAEPQQPEEPEAARSAEAGKSRRRDLDAVRG